MEEGEIGEGKSLTLTPTWALAPVVTVMVCFSFFFQWSLNQFGKWIDRTKRKALVSALEKIKDELMLFGVLSLLMGHWVTYVAEICVKSSTKSSRFLLCLIHDGIKLEEGTLESASSYTNDSSAREKIFTLVHNRDYCPEGHESFVSQESLEQLQRLMFALGVIHVLYSIIAVTLAITKIYSWNIWERQARTMAARSAGSLHQALYFNRRMTQLNTFISHRTSHPWSKHGVLVWLTHELPLTYDFHSYMLRSMDEEFCAVVGISLPLWIYAICCIFLDFHETDVYFWLSFLPVITILLIGTKLHRVVVKLAVETQDTSRRLENQHLILGDELFWFGKPKLLLWLIRLISFQNALEMATFLWSMWEIKDFSCFMSNQWFVIIRLVFGTTSFEYVKEAELSLCSYTKCKVTTQFWCSFITFPLYIIVTQMDAKFKKTVISKNIRQSLHGWKRRVKARHSSSSIDLKGLSRSTTLSSSTSYTSNSVHRSNSGVRDIPALFQEASSTPPANSDE